MDRVRGLIALPQVMQATPHRVEAVPYAALPEDMQAMVQAAWVVHLVERTSRSLRVACWWLWEQVQYVWHVITGRY